MEVKTDEPVLSVCLRRDLIIAIMETMISVFSFSDIPLYLFSVQTCFNPFGICSVSPSIENSFMAFPSSDSIGSVEIINLKNKYKRKLFAHKHEIQIVSFNEKGIYFLLINIL